MTTYSRRFSIILIGMFFALMPAQAQAETHTFDGTSIQVDIPDDLTYEIDEELGDLIIYNEGAEVIMYVVPADDPSFILEELYINFGLEEAAGAFDASNLSDDNDIGIPFTTYSTATDEAEILLGVGQVTAEDYIVFYNAVYDPSDENFEVLLEVLLTLRSDEMRADGGALMDSIPDISTEASTGESQSPMDIAVSGENEFADIEGIMAEFGVTGNLISVPEADAPFVDERATFQASDCIVPVPVDEDDSSMVCGILTVPENRTVSDSNRVELPVVILIANNSDLDGRNNPALIYLEGGPGGSGTVGVADWSVSPFRDSHDIVLFDQRGTGYASPSLNCPEVEFGEEDAEFACYNRLKNEGIDLTGYNTRENAADVAALIEQLGYDDVTIYGISYGTRLGLTMVREYSDLLTSAIIDAVYPPEVDMGAEEARYFYRALQTMFNDCAFDPACGSAFPDLENRFFATIDDMDANPVTAYDPNQDDQVELSGTDLFNAIFQAMYSTTIIPALPAAMDAATQGDYDGALDLITFGSPDIDFPDDIELTDDFAEGFDDAEAMFTSVTCNEEVNQNNVRDYIASFDAAYEAGDIPLSVLYLNFDISIFATCEVWESGTSSAVADMPVTGTLPVLVLSGAYDPVTPPAWGELAASRLDNAYFFNFPYSGHGLDQQPCARNVVRQFLDDPMSTPDGSCIDTMQPNFYIP